MFSCIPNGTQLLECRVNAPTAVDRVTNASAISLQSLLLLLLLLLLLKFFVGLHITKYLLGAVNASVVNSTF